MKISYNWLKEYLPEVLKPEEISVILTGTGLEVESLEPWFAIKGGLKGLLIAEVIEVRPHPNADKLKLTRVKIRDNSILASESESVSTSEGNYLNIVCGAPNVAIGQKVIVAPVGTSVHPLKGESFNISKSKIRGEWSEGMLCAEDEIGLGETHEGILILPQDAPIGKTASEYFNIQEDFVYEIGITPNRSDALSHRGVARDVTAFLRKPCDQAVVSAKYLPEKPGSKGSNGSNGSNELKNIPEIVIENPNDCIRFSGIVLEDVQIAQSPPWLTDKLLAIGIRPINNIVDITNFICHDMGQPMHAYDLDKLSGTKIVVGKVKEGSSLTTLDGLERKLFSDDLVVKDEQGALGLAGVFGGLNSSINHDTKRIFLESACFSPVAVRKTARRHGLNTDASFRFERGTDASLTIPALQKAVELMEQLSKASPGSTVMDVYPQVIEKAIVTLRRSQLDTIIGQHIKTSDVNAILEGLGIQIINHTEKETITEKWNLEIPLYKVDVNREADVIEEVLRIYGYNNIQAPGQLRSSLPFSSTQDTEKIQSVISNWLASRGLNEITTNSLISSTYLSSSEGSNSELSGPETDLSGSNADLSAPKADLSGSKSNLIGPESDSFAVRILNPLSQDMDVMRQSLLFTGLKVIAFNHNRREQDLRLFEFGKIYQSFPTGYSEKNMLCLYFTGASHVPGWESVNKGVKKNSLEGFFELKGHLESLFLRLNIKTIETEAGTIETEAGNSDNWLEASLRWQIKGDRQWIARNGKIALPILESMGIGAEVWYAEIDWDKILENISNTAIINKEISRFPSVRRDLSLLVKESVSYAMLRNLALGARIDILKEVNVFDVYRGEKLGKGLKSYALSFLLESAVQTLTDKEIDVCMDKLASVFSEQAAAEVRRS